MTVIFTPKLGAAVELIVLDVDGTLTDGVIHYDSNGGEHRHFHAADGLGIVMAQSVGLTVAVVSGRKSAVTERRMAELGVRDVVQGCGDKAAALRELMARHNVTTGHVRLRRRRHQRPAGVRAGRPQDRRRRCRAHDPRQADFVTARPGGHGGVRDAIEEILRGQGRLEQAVAAYLTRSAASHAPRQ